MVRPKEGLTEAMDHHPEVRIIAVLLIVVEVVVLHHHVVAAILAEAVAVHVRPLAAAVAAVRIHPVAAVEAVAVVAVEDKIMNNKKLKL